MALTPPPSPPPFLHVGYWILQTIAMLFTALVLPGLKISGFFSALLAVIVLAFVNAHFWDAALFFQIPDTISMRMLALLFINGLIFWLVIKILPGLEITGFSTAILAPVIFTLSSIAIAYVEKNVDWSHLFRATKETAEEVKEYVKDPHPSHVSKPVGF